MPKTARPSPPLSLVVPDDARPFALVGARVMLQRIVSMFPELRDELLALTNGHGPAVEPRPKRKYKRRAAADAPPDVPPTRPCAQCGRKFTSPNPLQKTCGRKRCVTAYKAQYMREWYAKNKSVAAKAAKGASA